MVQEGVICREEEGGRDRAHESRRFSEADGLAIVREPPGVDGEGGLRGWILPCLLEPCFC
jgi:hypothetical protein